VSAVATDVRPDLIDRLIELYCEWRTSCAEVQATYERFLGAASHDRAEAFAAYMAALDREQSACERYAGQIRLIQGRFSTPGRRVACPQTSRTDDAR
jgi:hypothetical protein